jgi:integrase/recombinase XerD
MSFESYLQSEEYSSTTIVTYERFANRFLEWMHQENLETDQVRYQDILAYMKYCQTKGNNRGTVQHTVIIVSHYFDYLEEIGEVKHNPAKGIKVQGVKRKVLYHTFEPNELYAIYHTYQHPTLSGRKNKVMIGLLVYQGLKTEELDKLEVKDVKLKEGKIEVPGGKRSNGRTMQLESHQMLDMYDYVMQVRPKILEKTKQQTNKLFVSLEGGTKLRIQYLTDQLKAQHPKVESFKQIRASVIVKWLRQYNLREVQYLAGHRYISSTESYQQNEMQGLSEEVNQFHPLG